MPNKYNIDVYFPNGILKKRHESVYPCTANNEVHIYKWLDVPVLHQLEAKYFGMLWFAELVDPEPIYHYNDWFSYKDRNNITIFDFNGRKLRKFKDVKVEKGLDYCQIYDNKSRTEIGMFKGPIECKPIKEKK